jgi:hypothetical protein
MRTRGWPVGGIPHSPATAGLNRSQVKICPSLSNADYFVSLRNEIFRQSFNNDIFCAYRSVCILLKINFYANLMGHVTWCLWNVSKKKSFIMPSDTTSLYLKHMRVSFAYDNRRAIKTIF